jgi:protein-S-isoprenylcysteine O-methyltransferase Ste14
MNKALAHEDGWRLAVVKIVTALWVLYRDVTSTTRLIRAGAGQVRTFIIAQFAEMEGVPLTIDLMVRSFGLSRPLLDAGIRPTMLGSGALGMMISIVLGRGRLFVSSGAFPQGWLEVYRARRKRRLPTTGLRARVRHPRYTGLFVGFMAKALCASGGTFPNALPRPAVDRNFRDTCPQPCDARRGFLRLSSKESTH